MKRILSDFLNRISPFKYEEPKQFSWSEIIEFFLVGFNSVHVLKHRTKKDENYTL